MSSTEKKDVKETHEKEKAPKTKKSDEERPISLVATFVFLFKAALFSAVVLAALVAFAGWRQLEAAGGPGSLPALVARRLGEGSFVPIHDGQRSLSVFVASRGVVEGSEETVVLLHGLPGSGLSFAEEQKKLADSGIASLAIDLPGFGLSDKPVGPDYSLDYLAVAVKETMAAMHVDTAHFVARGSGCFVLARLAEQWPSLVSSMVLLECQVPPVSPPSLPLYVFESSPILPRFVHAMLFGSDKRDSGEVAAANRWLTMHKGGQASYFRFASSGGLENVGEQPFAGLCSKRNCAMTGLSKLISGFVELEGGTLGEQLVRFVNELPAIARQNKSARPKPKVVYATPSGDKYGSHDHGHGQEGHVHGAGCSH